MTSGEYYAGLYTFSPDCTTVEWAVEAVDGSNFNKINKINFVDCYWYTSTSGIQYISSMRSSGLYSYKLLGKVYASAIGSDGKSFSFSYK